MGFEWAVLLPSWLLVLGAAELLTTPCHSYGLQELLLEGNASKRAVQNATSMPDTAELYCV